MPDAKPKAEDQDPGAIPQDASTTLPLIVWMVQEVYKVMQKE